MGRKINDRLLIRVLMRNSKLTNIALASLFKVSEAAIRKRIEKMENDGIILGYRAFINPTNAGMYISYTGVDVDPEHLISTYRMLRELKEVESVYLTSGDHNILAEIVCYDMETLTKIHESIEEMPGVKRVCPAVVTDVWKKGMK